MATIMAAATDTTAASFSAEEALLDAYDLQWKAIDIRLEKLRNECERMILEYEVEVKQQMYLRECEDLVRQQAAEHETQTATLRRELQGKDREVEDARAEAEAISQQQQQKKQTLEEKEAVVVAKKKAEKRKPVEEKPANTEEESAEEEDEEEMTKPKPKTKKQNSKKETAVEAKKKEEEKSKKMEEKKPKKKSQSKASEKPVERPLSPPVFSPEEEEEQTAQDMTVSLPTKMPSAANDDLLDMLTQEPEYESEDFGDASSLSLIHPQSPAVQSPPRPKQPTQSTAASPIRPKQPSKPVAASPMRAGVMSLTDRIRNRIQAIAKEPLDAQSDSSISPMPIEATPPPKRALKRRKTAVLGVTTTTSASTTAQAPAATNKDEEKANAVGDGAKPKAIKKKVVETESEQANGAEPEVSEPTAAGGAKKKTTGSKTTDDAKAKKKPAPPDNARNEPDEEEPPQNADDQDAAPAPTTKIASITGRSKARQTAKLAALRAAAEDDAFPMTGFSGINDIKTPKVPRVKLGMDGKKKQISDLASKRAEFQQIMSDSIRDDVEEQPASADEGPHAIAGKKRRRRDPEEKKQTAAEDADDGYGLKTPKPKAKKVKTNKNKFANDELNIMKSPVPLLRAKIAEKKKQEEAAAENIAKTNKRTVSEREGVDEEDPQYGSQAAAVPASAPITSQPAALATTALATTAKPPDEAKQAALDYANRWLNSGLVTRAKKNAVKAAKKPTAKAAKPASMWGSGPSFFDAFVNTAAPAIPRLKTASLLPKE